MNNQAANLKTWIVINSQGNAMTDKMTMEAAQNKANKMNKDCAGYDMSGSYGLKYVG